MKIWVSKSAKWMALVLWPFKTYIVVIIPFYFLLRSIYPHPLFTNMGNSTTVIDPLANMLLEIFMGCAPVLLVGAIIQFFLKDAKAGIYTLIFAVVPTLILAIFLFLWATEHLL